MGSKRSFLVTIGECLPRLCTWLDLYENRRKPFPVLLQGSNTAGNTVRGLKGDPPTPPPTVRTAFFIVGPQPCCQGAEGSADRGQTAHVALPEGKALPCGEFQLHFLLSTILAKSLFSTSQGLTPPKPRTLALVGFPASPRQWADRSREKAAKRNRWYLPGNFAPLSKKVKRLFEVFFPSFQIKNVLGP